MPGVTALCAQGSFAVLSVLDRCSGIQGDMSRLSENYSVTAIQRKQAGELKKKKTTHKSDLFGKKLLIFFLVPSFC